MTERVGILTPVGEGLLENILHFPLASFESLIL